MTDEEINRILEAELALATIVPPRWRDIALPSHVERLPGALNPWLEWQGLWAGCGPTRAGRADVFVTEGPPKFTPLGGLMNCLAVGSVLDAARGFEDLKRAVLVSMVRVRHGVPLDPPTGHGWQIAALHAIMEGDGQ